MSGIITTKKAQCKDCYRCLRTCPVKAIGFTTANQAQVNEDRCILCGRCVECPQQAKIIRSRSNQVRDILAGGRKVALSLAPSFPASFDLKESEFFARLYALGFSVVEETALGAALTIEGYRKKSKKKSIFPTSWRTCCRFSRPWRHMPVH